MISKFILTQVGDPLQLQVHHYCSVVCYVVLFYRVLYYCVCAHACMKELESLQSLPACCYFNPLRCVQSSQLSNSIAMQCKLQPFPSQLKAFLLLVYLLHHSSGSPDSWQNPSIILLLGPLATVSYFTICSLYTYSCNYPCQYSKVRSSLLITGRLLLLML